ncbi:MFS transporter [Streptomyces caatingaensis]|uniref:MFS transporter n=1 Tax=Streptomyces caatingaensis TaxID=1678637 RepID=A0A0K9X867_9ACTN|nr:MFS transporter [Streptomyces caatingaensis]KNB49276.1 hypothetical protein AC230_28730 [Streptomyces caatingaensis]
MGYIRLLRRRPVRVLWLSMTLSVIGDRLYAIATMWIVWESTHSSPLTGLVAVAESLPYVVLAGAREGVARFMRWRALARVDAARALLALSVPLLWTPDGTGLTVLLGLVLMLGVLGAVFDPNLGALIPQLASCDGVVDLHEVSGLFDLTARIAAVVGQGSVGAVLLLVPEIQLYAIDGLTFAVSAAALTWLGRHAAGVVGRAAAQRPPAAGRRLLRAHRPVAAAVAVSGVAQFAAAVPTVGLPPLIAVRLGQGAAGYGLTLAATAAGALVGNLLTPGLPAGRRWLGTYCAAWVLSGVALAGLGLATTLTAAVALCVAGGLLFPVTAVTLRARLSRFAPAERVALLTAHQSVTRAAGAAGLLLLPYAVDAAPGGSFVGAGLLLSVLAAAGWWLGRRPTGRAVPTADGSGAAEHGLAG